MINFSFKECLWFLNRNFDDCLHVIGPDYVRKAILINDELVLFEISEGVTVKEFSEKKLSDNLINDKPLLSETNGDLRVKESSKKRLSDNLINHKLLLSETNGDLRVKESSEKRLSDNLINHKPLLSETNRDLTVKESSEKRLSDNLINHKPLLSETNGDLTVKVLQGPGSPDEFIREWFDLDTDIQPFYEQLAAYKDLAYMSREFAGLRLMGIPDLFEAICWCIIGQQINLTFAYRIKRRLVETYSRYTVYEGQQYYTFPSPEVLADADPVLLKSMQLSGKKIEYLMGVAQVFKEGQMSKEILLSLKDVTAQQKALTAIRGIGIWTANYTLMKTLRVPSAIPYGDAGLLNALMVHKIITDKKDLASIDRFFQQFKGWESYLVFYLWRSLAPQSL